MEHVNVFGTPRRLAVMVDSLAPRQPDRADLVKGPSADRAFGSDGVPTPAAIGFARSKGVQPKALEVREMDGGRYAVALVKQAGRPTSPYWSSRFRDCWRVSSLTSPCAGCLPPARREMVGVVFSRPIRWLVALLGEFVIPFEYAGLTAGRTTRGLRPYNSPEIDIPAADKYFEDHPKEWHRIGCGRAQESH